MFGRVSFIFGSFPLHSFSFTSNPFSLITRFQPFSLSYGHKSTANHRPFSNVEKRSWTEMNDDQIQQISSVMTSPPMVCQETDSVSSVRDLFLQRQLERMPVVSSLKEMRVVGMIDVWAVFRAVEHNLGKILISSLLKKEVTTASCSSRIESIRDDLDSEGMVCITEDSPPSSSSSGKLIGVVTKKDTLPSPNFCLERAITIDTFKNEIGGWVYEALDLALMCADSCRLGDKQEDFDSSVDLLQLARRPGQRPRLFIVGGIIRDLLMRQKRPVDLDIVIEGCDPAIFCLRYAKAAQSIHKPRINPQFFTGQVSINTEWLFRRFTWRLSSESPEIAASLERDGTNSPVAHAHGWTSDQNAIEKDIKIDICGSRLEYYTKPAQLPVVELSSIKMDLRRRDFTINAMAVQIFGPSSYHLSQGAIIDNFNGFRDLHLKIIRTLHPLSFVDDPTRIFRAIRFASRLSFHFDEQTEMTMRISIDNGSFGLLTGDRIRHELILISKELDFVSTSFDWLGKLGIFQAVSPLWKPLDLNTVERVKMTLQSDMREFLNPEELLHLQPWQCFYFASIFESSDEEIKKISHRLGLQPGTIKNLLLSVKQSRIVVERVGESGDVSPSEFFHLAEKLIPVEVLLALYSLPSSTEQLRHAIRHFLSKSRMIAKTSGLLNGEEIQGLFQIKGPSVGKLKIELFNGVLDEKVSATSKDEQARFLRSCFSNGNSN